ncbi:MAG TPA: RNA 3'-terminal phosphate cyclase, partial [Anaerolineae bacterium]|nr:RNA 3'-terminal phosphate cyclase [Anaerolineae bacterium]
AVAELTPFWADETAAVDQYLADQILLPSALARGKTVYRTVAVTQHTLTQADLLRRWLDVEIIIEGKEGEAGEIIVEGVGWNG